MFLHEMKIFTEWFVFIPACVSICETFVLAKIYEDVFETYKKAKGIKMLIFSILTAAVFSVGLWFLFRLLDTSKLYGQVIFYVFYGLGITCMLHHVFYLMTYLFKLEFDVIDSLNKKTFYGVFFLAITLFYLLVFFSILFQRLKNLPFFFYSLSALA
jgi:hypothetical protein